MILNYFLMTLIVGARAIIGPAQCKFEEGCTAFAVRQLKEESLFRAIRAIFSRIIRCNPFF